MTKQIGILRNIKKYINHLQTEKEKQRLEEKQEVLSLLDRSWTESQIKDYNINLIANSAGWLGGDYNERDIKRSLLRDNADLFSKEEYERLHIEIYAKVKIII